MIVHGLKNCDRTRAAVKALVAAGKAPVVRDLRDDPPAADEISGWLARLGPRLVNRASTTWRGLTESERAAESVDLLCRHPTLIKRPVIADGARLTLGWDARVEASWL